jgi:hypothetical protein
MLNRLADQCKSSQKPVDFRLSNNFPILHKEIVLLQVADERALGES